MGEDAVEKFREKLSRVWRAGRAAALNDMSDLVRQGMGWIGCEDRDHPYDEHERAYMGMFNPFRKRALVAHDREIFALTLEGYQSIGTVDGAMADAAVAAHGLDVTPADTPLTLLRRHGMRVRELRYTYGATETVVREAQVHRSSLTLPCAPRSKEVTAARSALVEDFVVALVGEGNAPTLLDWMAWLPHTDHPLACAFIHGPKGIGKNLLASGIARLWGGFTTLDHALSDFPEPLLRSPFVWGDEGFPKDASGRHKTEDFRRIITAREHRINRKFRNITTLVGCVRVLMTANNDDMFRVLNLTADDVGAIADRVLDFHVESAGPALAFLGRVNPDVVLREIPGHVLWMYTSARPEPRGRFLVQGSTAFAEKLSVMGSIPSRIFEMVYDFLAAEGRDAGKGLLVREGKILVLPGHVRERWIGTPPPAVFIGTALGSISSGKKFHKETSRGIHGLYYVVDRKALDAWVDLSGSNPAVVAAGLERDLGGGVGRPGTMN